MIISPKTAVKITKVTRANGRLIVRVSLTDTVTNASKGDFEHSWEEATELPEFLAQNATLDNFMANAIEQSYNSVTGKYAVDGLVGKSFNPSGSVRERV